MSTPSTQPTPPAAPTAAPSISPSSPSTPQPDAYSRLKHTTSLSLLFACPVLIFLPPRKLDFYTFSLSTAWVLSLNQLSRERSGRSILERVDAWRPAAMRDLPAGKAEEVRERLRRERAMREREGKGVGVEEGEKEKGVVGKLWMGSEDEGWKERRLREEREALEEGRGYAGLIMDQIWEVWNWGKGEEKRGEVVEEGRGAGGSEGRKGKGDEVIGGKGRD